MKKIFKIIAVVVLLILASGTIVFFFFPETLVDQTNASYARAANLEKKTVDVNGYYVNYYENEDGNKPDLVLLPGMGDDKSSFLQTAKFLSEDYHLILPD